MDEKTLTQMYNELGMAAKKVFDLVEFQKTAKELTNADRVNFFWTTLTDGSIVNGGATIIEVRKDISGLDAWVLVEEEQYITAIKKYDLEELMAICLQGDYGGESWSLVHKDMPVSGYSIVEKKEN